MFEGNPFVLDISKGLAGTVTALGSGLIAESAASALVGRRWNKDATFIWTSALFEASTVDDERAVVSGSNQAKHQSVPLAEPNAAIILEAASAESANDKPRQKADTLEPSDVVTAPALDLSGPTISPTAAGMTSAASTQPATVVASELFTFTAITTAPAGATTQPVQQIGLGITSLADAVTALFSQPTALEILGLTNDAGDGILFDLVTLPPNNLQEMIDKFGVGMAALAANMTIEELLTFVASRPADQAITSARAALPSTYQVNPNIQAPSYAITADMIAIEASSSDGDIEGLLRSLEALGLQQGMTAGNLVNGWLPVTSLPQASALLNLQEARGVLSTSNVGATTTGDDIAQRTDDVRTATIADGTGQTIGILSDSLNNLSGAAGVWHPATYPLLMCYETFLAAARTKAGPWPNWSMTWHRGPTSSSIGRLVGRLFSPTVSMNWLPTVQP